MAARYANLGNPRRYLLKIPSYPLLADVYGDCSTVILASHQLKFILFGLYHNTFQGVIKSIVGEVTGSTNRARGFAWTLVAAAAGGSIGYESLSIKWIDTHRNTDPFWEGC